MYLRKIKNKAVSVLLLSCLMLNSSTPVLANNININNSQVGSVQRSSKREINIPGNGRGTNGINFNKEKYNNENPSVLSVSREVYSNYEGLNSDDYWDRSKYAMNSFSLNSNYRYDETVFTDSTEGYDNTIISVGSRDNTGYSDIDDISGVITIFDKDSFDYVSHKLVDSNLSDYVVELTHITKTIEDDGYLVVGTEFHNGRYSNRNGLLIKFDKDFNEVKRTKFNNMTVNYINSFEIVNDKYLITGYSTSGDAYFITYNEDLSVVKNHKFTLDSSSNNVKLKYNQTEGNYYCINNKTIYKLDQNYGKIKSISIDNAIKNLVVDSDGSILVVYYDRNRDSEYYLEKYDNELNFISEFFISEYDSGQGSAPIVATDNGYLVLKTENNVIIELDKDLKKIDEIKMPNNPDEYQIYTFFAEESGTAYTNSLKILEDGTLLVSGRFWDKLNLVDGIRYYGKGAYSAFVACFDMESNKVVGEEPTLIGYSSGDGSKENPYIIDNVEQLSLLSIHTGLGLVNIADNFKLNADINMDDYDWDGDISNGNFISIGFDNLPFTGNFDGNNHKISNLKIYDDIEAGLFGSTFESTIKNLTFENVDIESEEAAGVLASCLEASIVDNVKILGDINLRGYCLVGSLAGWSVDVEVSNVYVDSPTIYGNYDFGGFIGEQASDSHFSTFTNCIIENLNLIALAEGSYVGGFSGEGYLPIYNDCYITGKIDVNNVEDYAQIGGFIGYFETWELDENPESIFNNSYANIDIHVSGDTEDTVYVGGFIGECYGDLPDSTLFNNCNYKGSIIVDNPISTVGGLLGYACTPGNIYKSNADVVIESTGSAVGGLIGYADEVQKIEQSYATGKVKGENEVGGLVGDAEFGVSIENSYADLILEGSKNVGGLVGFANPEFLEIKDSYAATTILDLNNVLHHGPIVGGVPPTRNSSNEEANIVDVYYDKDIVKTFNNHRMPITGLSTEQMIGRATYDNMNLDYDNIWYIRGNNYPVFNYSNTPPVVNEYTVEVLKGSDFEAIGYLIATDAESASEDLIGTVIRDEVNTSIVGNYEVEFEVTDEGGLSDRGVVTIKVLEDLSPTITAFDKVIYLYNDFYPFEGVTAMDAEDGDITKDIKVSPENIDTTQVGTHKVIYEVTDSADNTTTKEIKVDVIKGDVNTPSINYENEIVTINDNGTNIPLHETEEFEDEDLLFEFTNPNWTIEDGKMKSEPIGDSSSTENTFEIYANEGDNLYIDVIASSEEGYDTGYIYLNGKSIISFSGNITKNEIITLQDGLNTIKLIYEKDYSGSDGDDCIYIDEIRYTKGTKPVDSLSYRLDGSEWSNYDNPFRLEGYEIGDTVLVEAKATTDGIDSDIRKKYIIIGGNKKPELFIDDNIKTEIDKDFNYKDYVKAEDFEDGDISDKVIMNGIVDTTQEGDYEVTFEVTDNGGLTVSQTVIVTVIIPNRIPVIHAEDLKVELNSTFIAEDYATATDEEDGDITDRIIVKEDTVNTSVKGDYKVTYEVTDNADVTVSKTIKVSVVDPIEELPPAVNEAPVINASDKTLCVGDKFDELSGVTAIDKEDGNITYKLKVDYNNVDTSKAGAYKVVYSVEDSNANKTVKEIKVTVNPAKNEAPVINIPNKDVNVGDKFEPLKGVTAYDKEDGDLTDSIIVENGNIDTSKPGKHEVTYKVTDSAGNTTTKKITIVVKVSEENNSNNNGNNNSNSNNSNTDENNNENKPQTGDYGLMFNSVLIAVSLLGLILLNRKKDINKK